MPFKSEAQRRWAYTKEGTKALGGKEKVLEWEKATKDKDLPLYKNENKGGEENERGSFRARNRR